MSSEAALEEVRSLRVDVLHHLPLTCSLFCCGEEDGMRVVVFTTDWDYHQMERSYGPRSYMARASPGQRWGDFFRRWGLSLWRIELYGGWAGIEPRGEGVKT